MQYQCKIPMLNKVYSPVMYGHVTLEECTTTYRSVKSKRFVPNDFLYFVLLFEWTQLFVSILDAISYFVFLQEEKQGQRVFWSPSTSAKPSETPVVH